jgi:serine/threonine protein kinase
MACDKHPLAAARNGLCAVCLFESALAPGVAMPPRRLTVHLPLALTPAGAVYLVRQEAPTAALLRLKTWNRVAPGDFLDRFQALRRELEDASEMAIVLPLAASVDGDGSPSVVTEFRRGVPVGDAVRSGTLSTQAATSLIGPLRDLLRRTHALGLVHGAIVSGNVIVRPDLTAAFLVDFGLTALLSSPPDPAAGAAADEAALDALTATLQAS